MAIGEDVLKAAALALSDAAKSENIYLPQAKARRMIEPALQAAIEVIALRSPNPRVERTRMLLREVGIGR